jgi:phage tail sheath protein FI
MAEYLAPGVYVEEVPSAVKPIAGVGTSTAGFVGVVTSSAVEPTAEALKGRTLLEAIGNFPRDTTVTDANVDAVVAAATAPVEPTAEALKGRTLRQAIGNFPSGTTVTETNVGAVVAAATAPSGRTAAVQVEPLTAVQVEPLTAANQAGLCTNFSEFVRYFGGFSTDRQQNYLAHAVYGFFNNGGSRCWVVRTTNTDTTIQTALEQLELIDEIALVAVPGATHKDVQQIILDHCQKESLQDRFAILDGRQATDLSKVQNIAGNDNDPLPNSSYGAIYFPWIKVFDPISMAKEGIAVPPSGHLAGVYARVDTARGVHKAPANEVIRGALDVTVAVSKEQQAGLNPAGINILRKFDGNITVWGARTWARAAEAEWRYINVRRLFLYLRKSIDQGTQWVVFEPNEPGLWARIERNVTAFLTNVWRAGALFGATPQEAFYVKCDAETNPPELRDLGRVVTEIGVAVVKPAEFVVFRISQWAGPGS